MAKQILYPFSSEPTNRHSLPDKDPGTGYVSYQSGYPINYQLELGVQSGALPVERLEFNALMYDVTDNIQEWQGQAFPTWQQMDGIVLLGYPLNAFVNYQGRVYCSLKANNLATPTDTTSWELQLTTNQILSKIPLIYQGTISAAINFNSLNYNGVWDVPTDSIASGSANCPSSSAGTLFVKVIDSVGRVLQNYCDATGNVYYRTYSSGWGAWNSVAMTNGVVVCNTAPITASTNWNTLITPGHYTSTSAAGANAAPNSGSGNLLVVSSTGGTSLTQIFYPANTSYPTYTRYATYTGGTWTFSVWTTATTGYNYNNNRQISSSTTLDDSYYGNFVELTGANFVVTLPPSTRAGGTITFYSTVPDADVYWGIQHGIPTGKIWFGTSLNNGYVNISAGQSLTLTCDGTSWLAIQGSALSQNVSYSSTVQFNGSTTLGTEHLGKTILMGGGGTASIGLPDAIACPTGSRIRFLCQNLSGDNILKYIVPSVSGQLYGSLGGIASLPMSSGAWAEVVRTSAGTWITTGGDSCSWGKLVRDVTGLRAVDTIYTNTTGREMMVQVCGGSSGASAYVDNRLATKSILTAPGTNAQVTFLVPPFSEYYVSLSGGVTLWTEFY